MKEDLPVFLEVTTPSDFAHGLKEDLPMFLEVTTPFGFAHGHGRRNLRAGFHHVHALEEHIHAAKFPD